MFWTANVAGAMLDRLLHRSVVFNIEGQLQNASPPGASRTSHQQRRWTLTDGDGDDSPGAAT